MNKEFEKIINFEISYDEDFIRNLYPIPYELEEQMDDLYELAFKAKKSGIKRISRLIEQYPKVAVLKNLLTLLYNRMGNNAKAHELNHIIIEKHPNYLYGKFNLASEYYNSYKYEKMPEVLGSNFNLKELCPERDTFHIDEVQEMFKMAISYYSAVGDFDDARIRLDFLEEKSSEDFYENIRSVFQTAMMATRITEDDYSVDVAPTILKNNVVAPNFSIELVKQLYIHDLEIDHDIIKELLSSNRELLINDLNMVLSDSIERYKYFLDKSYDEGYKEKDMSFLLHALFLLGELEASESLENIFEVLSQDYDFVDFYISDILTEYVWISLYRIVNYKLDECKQFMQRPGIDAFHKSVISEAIMQIAQQQPQRREEVVNWYRDLFTFFSDSSIEDNVIDSGLLGMMISDVLDFNGKELLPEIEELYKWQMVELFACGNFDKVKSEMEKPISDSQKDEILDIYDIYENINSWLIDDDSESDIDNEKIRKALRGIAALNHPELPISPIAKEGKKVGRNEPCPCGSGKKYKKCCLNKT